MQEQVFRMYTSVVRARCTKAQGRRRSRVVRRGVYISVRKTTSSGPELASRYAADPRIRLFRWHFGQESDSLQLGTGCPFQLAKDH